MKANLNRLISMLFLLALVTSIKLSTRLQTLPAFNNELSEKEYLLTGSYLRSQNGKYTLKVQTVGNVVVNGCTKALWATGTNNSTN
jgi:hypothetical protein